MTSSADTGVVVPTRDVDALAAALDGLAADRSRLAALGHRARRRAEGLGWDACVESYEAAMIATVGSRGRVLSTARPAAATVPAPAPAAAVTRVG